MPVRSHYLWLVDNLLDPSHVAWVHRSSFAGAGTDNTPLQITSHADGVVASRWTHASMPNSSATSSTAWWHHPNTCASAARPATRVT